MNRLTYSILPIPGLLALFYPYGGIIGDARMYALQLLANNSAKELKQDIFLKYTSQDLYSAYSSLFGIFPSLFGIEASAAALTAFGQLSFLISYFVLSRKLNSPTSWAYITTYILLLLPNHYGAASVVGLMESFMSPRPLSQAATLTATTLWLQGHLRSAVVLIVLAMMIHPLMAMAGVVLLSMGVLLAKGLPTHGFRHPFIVRPSVAYGIGLFLIAALPALGMRHFDSLALELTRMSQVQQRAPYLFLSTWTHSDWAGVVTPLVTLWLAARLGRATSQQTPLLDAAWLTGAVGLVLSALHTDLWPNALVTQGQPWRWHWISIVVAMIVLPRLLVDAWKRSMAWRSVSLLLGLAWLMRDTGVALELSLVSWLVAHILLRGPLTPRLSRLITLGCLALSLVAVVYLVATLGLREQPLNEAAADGPLASMLDFLRRHRPVALLLVLPALWLLSRPHTVMPSQTLRRSVLVVACLSFAVVFIPHETTDRLAPATSERLLQWSAMIAPTDEVLWYDHPELLWTRLQRMSYFSSAQTPAALFSEQAAAELRRRAGLLRQVTSGGEPLEWVNSLQLQFSTDSLAIVCGTLGVPYVISMHRFDLAPIDRLNGREHGAFNGLSLYRCPSASAVVSR